MEDDISTNSDLEESIQFEISLIMDAYEREFKRGKDDFHFSLTLTPQVDSSPDEASPTMDKVYVSVRLDFDVSPPYPKTPVKCQVFDVRVEGISVSHLSQHQIEELQCDIEQCAKDRAAAGDTAVMEVAQRIRDYLTDHNRPSESLHEEMETRRKEEKNRQNSESCCIVRDGGQKKYPPCVRGGDTKSFYNVNGRSFDVICTVAVSRGRIIKGYDIKNQHEVLVHEFILKETNESNLKSVLNRIERLLDGKTLVHKNLVRMIGSSIPLTAGKVTSNVVHLVTNAPLPLMCFGLPYHNTRKLAEDMVRGLSFLHGSGEFHELLSLDCVYYDPSAGVHQIGEYGAWKRIIKESTRPATTCSWFEKRKGRSLDILLLGYVIIHASVGSCPSEPHPQVPSHLKKPLRNFIKLCIAESPSLETLLGHEFITGAESTPIITSHSETQNLHYSSTDACSGQSKSEGEGIWSKSQRFKNEFKFIEELGKGGFATVIKVKNNFDNNLYAMKVIKLVIKGDATTNIESVRSEAKHLSQLQHHNIVHYNYAFIEEFDENDVKSEMDSEDDIEDIEDSDSSSCSFGRSPSPSDDFDISFRYSEARIRSRYNNPSDTESICFEDQSYSRRIEESSDSSESDGECDSVSLSSPINKVYAVFIQMEYCENKTLRTLIDQNKLYGNLDYILKLLREIIDGLEYIHQKSIIHRDLKPPNILLDSRNVVKIGDFGLAFSDAGKKTKGNQSNTVGTLLYMAPEVKTKKKYSAQNDIYSLGIIFFEMLHHPFCTKQERIEVIESIRHKDIIFPENVFPDSKFEDLTRRMLSHSPDERPTSSLLAKCDFLPPRLEEESLQELLTFINAGPDSLLRHQLLRALFENDVAEEVRKQYDRYDRSDTETHTLYFTQTMNDIIDRMASIFVTHGAQQFPLPFLLPKDNTSSAEAYDTSFFFLSHLGYTQTLPSNLKVNLIRHVVKNRISNLKRYGFSQVFNRRRDLSDKNPNPREILEGSFDVVSSGSKVIAAAEVLTVVLATLDAMPYFVETKKTIYINHTKIVKAILSHFGISERYHSSAIKMMYQTGTSGRKFDDIHFTEVNRDLGDRQIKPLLKILSSEGPFHEILKDIDFKRITEKSKETNKNLVQSGLREILQLLILVCDDSPDYHLDMFNDNKPIKDLIEKLKTCPAYGEQGLQEIIKIRPGLVNDPSYYDGLMFQVVLEKPDHQNILVVVAVGGDFTFLVDVWRGDSTDDLVKDPAQTTSAFGVTFLLEDIATVENTIKDEIRANSTKYKVDQPKAYSTHVLVVSSTNTNLQESLQIHRMLRTLWSYKIKAQHIVERDHEDNSISYRHLVRFKDSDITIESDHQITKLLKNTENFESFDKYKKLKLDDAIKYLIQRETALWNRSLDTAASSSESRRSKEFGRSEGGRALAPAHPKVTPRSSSSGKSARRHKNAKNTKNTRNQGRSSPSFDSNA